MTRKITYTDELLGEMEVVADFLPSPTRNGNGVLGPLQQPCEQNRVGPQIGL